MINKNRTHKSYVAFVGHRISGVALALFLPFHFLLLGTALKGSEGLSDALALASHPLFKVAEWGLVVFLAVHLLFGIRVLALELTTWPTRHDNRTGWVVPAVLTAFFVGVVFWILAS